VIEYDEFRPARRNHLGDLGNLAPARKKRSIRPLTTPTDDPDDAGAGAGREQLEFCESLVQRNKPKIEMYKDRRVAGRRTLKHVSAHRVPARARDRRNQEASLP